jgi:hypothetical protein
VKRGDLVVADPSRLIGIVVSIRSSLVHINNIGVIWSHAPWIHYVPDWMLEVVSEAR